ncbi:HU family DNA-binding protein [Sulfoacidibacillus ferrooxidans]|uniref:DNA-binding protein HU n=1 Tax=Sulfoacidibacillus ferrooxidans TaxID=2005001 RepID=A0A9X1VF35_9BACL|nr:HU family DNA-binding protein [Sulfoacidibacillus ferrooxidans]MCI0184852.1 DNA-binding protein HU [Sulfoacidibacillus ferrooxidans]
MNKDSLLTRAQEKSGMTKKELTIAWDALQVAMHEELKNGEDIMISNVGKIKPILRAARKARNPQTGEEITIGEKETIKLVVSTKY